MPHILLLLVLLQNPSARQASELVAASDPALVTTPNHRQSVEFTVMNFSNQPVTAWEATVAVSFLDGGIKTWGLEREAYGEYEGVRPGTGNFIPPNSSVRGRVLIGSFQPSDIIGIRVSLRWAVFADRGWVGHSGGVQDLFNRRQRDYDVLLSLLSTLREGQALADPLQGLRQALTALSVPGQNHDHSATRQMRLNLQMAIDQHSALRVTRSEFLRTWISRIAAQLRAADAHRTPKYK